MRLRQSLRERRFQRDAAGCKLLSSNQSLTVSLTEPVVSESDNCALLALGGSASAQAEVAADGLVHHLGCLRQRGVDWNRGPGRGSVGLAERSFAPGPHSRQA